jgi:hypothetical protein
MRPAPALDGVIRRFTRSKEQPLGVVWFGATSFWGHLRHLMAGAIATENIDSRVWMTPDTPHDLIARITSVLGGNPDGASLAEALGRDYFVDFVADTGDDVAVSRAVARLIFAAYELPDPDMPGEVLRAPRGDILFFGGDTAYPVATAAEITARVITPWNQVLQQLPDDGQRRVLLGIPGNHDWYDGLDGFSRMFRRREPGDDARRPEPAPSEGMLQHYAEWAREFVRGGSVAKPRALVLSGYTPVQSASYFAFALAPDVDLLAVDRQLTKIDERQNDFLRDYERARPESATLVILPDPVYHFGEPSKTGTWMIETLRLDLAGRETFVLTGDIHHYERLARGKALHVIAGGGGAFLHPARIAEGGLPPVKVWPDVEQSRLLLREVPWKLARGRSGFLPHLCLVLLFAPLVLMAARNHVLSGGLVAMSAATTLFLAGVYALIGGAARRHAVLPVAFCAALMTTLIPVGVARLMRLTLEQLGQSNSVVVVALATLVIAVFTGSLLFGGYLALLTLRGYENMQALTVLDHPGFKHFVRLRVRADGTGVDGWCIGVADPLGERSEPVLVDHFVWRPIRRRK